MNIFKFVWRNILARKYLYQYYGVFAEKWDKWEDTYIYYKGKKIYKFASNIEDDSNITLDSLLRDDSELEKVGHIIRRGMQVF